MGFEAFEKLTAGKQNTILMNGIKEFSTKCYNDVSTDNITKNSGISKGILFHYFGNKREFYKYCLTYTLDKLTPAMPISTSDDFYEIIFSSMKDKLNLWDQYPDEIKFLNMSSKDQSKEIIIVKEEVFPSYYSKVMISSSKTMEYAVSTLNLKEKENKTIHAALNLYVNAVMNRYLQQYNNKPKAFFDNAATIQAEIKEYIDLMLYGIL